MSEQTSIPADPEVDPTASYATDQSVIRRLSGLLRASAGTRTSYAPATGQPIADLPISSPDDVVGAVRSARKTQLSWSGGCRWTSGPRSCCATTTWSWITGTSWSTW